MIIHARDAGVAEINMILQPHETRALQTALEKIRQNIGDILSPTEKHVINNIHLALMKRSVQACGQ